MSASPSPASPDRATPPDARSGVRHRRWLILSSVLGLAILAAVYSSVDLREMLAQISRLGALGCGAFVLSIVAGFMAHAVGWHLLMRAEGIPVSLRRTVAAALMGQAANLVMPTMYFGGEAVRIFYIAGACGVPKRRVAAALIVSEFQKLSALTSLILAGIGVGIATSAMPGSQIVAAAAAGILLAAFLALILTLVILAAKPGVRILDLLARLRIFPSRLRKVRDQAEEMENLLHEAFTRRWRLFLLTQFITLLSPVLTFVRPLLFFELMRRAGAGVILPSLAQLSVFFVLSQLLFMIPATPAGLGVFEGGVIGLFKMLGWPAAAGAAYGVLNRIDDLLYVTLGAWLVVRHGLARLMTESPSGDAPAEGPDGKVPVAVPGPAVDSTRFIGPSFQLVDEIEWEELAGDGAFVPRTRPLLVKGAVRAWPAWERWSFEGLAALRRPDGSDVVFRFQNGLVEQGVTRPPLDLPVGPYIRGLAATAGRAPLDGAGLLPHARWKRLAKGETFRLNWSHMKSFEADRVYLAQWNILDEFPELRRDFAIRRLWPGWRWTWEFVFIGPANTVTGLHYDFPNNWFCQVRGTKEVILFPRDQARHMCKSRKYDWGATLSDIDISRLDGRPGQRAEFQKARGYYARVEPGDALFIPKRTWHAVVALEPSISLGVFGLTPWEIVSGGGPSQARHFLHKLRLYRWGNCTCHRMTAPALAAK